jgi:hypothetical protein
VFLAPNPDIPRIGDTALQLPVVARDAIAIAVLGLDMLSNNDAVIADAHRWALDDQPVPWADV